MRSRRKPWATVVLAAVIATSATYAQSPAPGADPPAKPARPVKLTLPEMVARAGTLQDQIRADMRHVLHLREKTRKEKDVIKLNCINDKMVQLKAQVNIFDAANDSLKAGLETAGTGLADDDKQQTFVEVSATADAIKSLRAEADLCVGEPELYKQESSSDVKRPEILDDPTATDPFGPASSGFEAPAYASPFN